MKYSALIPTIVLAQPAITFAYEVGEIIETPSKVYVVDSCCRTLTSEDVIGYISAGGRFKVLKSVPDKSGDREKDDWYYIRILSGWHRTGEEGSGNEGWICVGSCCFITTACVRARGLADDCLELTILRKFRDLYVASSNEWKCSIAEYYSFASAVVQAINRCGRPDLVYAEIYKNLVAPSVDLTLARHFQEAFEHYKRVALQLRGMWLN